MEKGEQPEEFLITSPTGEKYVVRPATKKDLTLHQAQEVDIGGEGTFLRDQREIRKFTTLIRNISEYVGVEEVGSERKHKWQNPDKTVSALFPVDFQDLIEKGRKPVSGTQAKPKLTEKNFDTLRAMLQKKNDLREKEGLPKTGEIEFSLKEYALARKYTEEEIARGGVFLEELKKDLFSGALTSYAYKKIEGKEGRRTAWVGVSSFYQLGIPEARKDVWKIRLNEPFLTQFLEGKQFYPVLIRAIQDRTTDGKRAYLYAFGKDVGEELGEWRETGANKQRHAPFIKVHKRLEKCGVGSHTLSRPNETYETLKTCLTYTLSLGIANTAIFKGHLHTGKSVSVDIGALAFLDYPEFKLTFLEPIGVTDIRNANLQLKTAKESKETGREGDTHGGEEVTSL